MGKGAGGGLIIILIHNILYKGGGSWKHEIILRSSTIRVELLGRTGEGGICSLLSKKKNHQNGYVKIKGKRLKIIGDCSNLV